MTHLPLTAAVTLLIVLLLFATAANVGRARSRYGVKAPATQGHEQFERAFRIQMNTLEWAVLFLPALWLLAAYVGDRHALAVGLFGLFSRIVYAWRYQRDPATRGAGFIGGMLAFAVAGLWGGAAVARAAIAALAGG